MGFEPSKPIPTGGGMSIPIPSLSFSSTKQQTAVSTSQNLVFTPTISVMTQSPGGSTPSSFNIPTTQTPTVSQSQPTSFSFSPVPGITLGSPVGDLYGQSPLKNADKTPAKEASLFDDNMLIILLIAGGAALLLFGKKK
jgi:hypothetical protein